MTWLGGAAGLAAVAAFWGKIKSVAARLASVLVVTIKCEGDASRALSLYCWAKLRRSPFGHRTYSAKREYVRPLRRIQSIACETIGYAAVWFWRGWRPLLLRRKEGAEHQDWEYDQVSVSFIRGTWDLDKLVVDAMDIFNKHREASVRCRRFHVQRYVGLGAVRGRGYPASGEGASTPDESEKEDIALGDKRILRWKPDEIGADAGVEGCLMESLAFPPEVADIVAEAERWLKSEQWYRQHQIPWRRGWLLYGPTGTGKTSLVRAVAQMLDLPIHAFDLASMSNEELVGYWRRMLGAAPCVALFEDIDSVFEGREGRLGEMGGGLTFDCFLNCLSGVEGCDGVFVMVTTNRPEKLDDALGTPRKGGESNGTMISTRPGRIDRAIKIDALDEACRAKLARRILGRDDATLVRSGDGDTGCQFVERCTQVAVREFWEVEKENADG